MGQACATTTFVSTYSKYAAAYVSHTYLANCLEYVGITNVTQYYEYLKQMKFE